MRSITILCLTIALSCLVAIYQAALFYLGSGTSAEFEKLWGTAFVLLLAFWVDADSKDRPQVYKPSFDFGFFVYMGWLLYLPYYLIRTRGGKGWIWLLGLITLAFLGYLPQLVIYAIM